MPRSEIATALAQSGEGVDFTFDEETQEFLRKMAAMQHAVVRLDEPDGFPFWEARQATTGEAAYSQWGVSIQVVSEIVDTFLMHAARIYDEEYRLGADDPEEEVEEEVEESSNGALAAEEA